MTENPYGSTTAPSSSYPASAASGTDPARSAPGMSGYVPGQFSGGGTGPQAPYVTPAPWAGPGDQQSRPAATYPVAQDQTLLVVAWVVTVLTAFYMLPWAVAVTRRRPDATMIALVTVAVAWTGIGWVIALVWSLSGSTHGRVPVLPPAGWYPSPTGAGQQYWDGYAWTGHTHP